MQDLTKDQLPAVLQAAKVVYDNSLDFAVVYPPQTAMALATHLHGPESAQLIERLTAGPYKNCWRVTVGREYSELVKCGLAKGYMRNVDRECIALENLCAELAREFGADESEFDGDASLFEWRFWWD